MKSLEKIPGQPNKRKKESEKDIERYLATQILRNGGLCYKWVSPNNRGVPDRICIFPSSKIIFVECKSEGCKMSKMQIALASLLKTRCGIKVYIVDSKKSVDKLIEQFYKEFNYA